MRLIERESNEEALVLSASDRARLYDRAYRLFVRQAYRNIAGILVVTVLGINGIILSSFEKRPAYIALAVIGFLGLLHYMFTLPDGVAVEVDGVTFNLLTGKAYVVKDVVRNGEKR